MAGSLVAFWPNSVTSRPMPPRRPVEISDTTTPMTAPAAPSFSAGHDVGHRRREAQLEQRAMPRRRKAVHQFERCGRRRLAGRVSVPTAMGKNVRNAPAADGRDPARPLPAADLHLAAPGGHQWGQRDERHGLRDDEVRQDRPLGHAQASHQHRQQHARDEPHREACQHQPEREPARLWPPPTARSRPRTRLIGSPNRLPDVADVRHDRVLGARQDLPAEHVAAVLRAEPL